MPRTVTPAPLDSPSYWRRLKACVHPDREGGSEELFVFLCALEEHVREGRAKPWAPPGSGFAGANQEAEQEPERIPYDPVFGNAGEFHELTLRALRIGRELGEPYGQVLGLLVDLPVHDHGRAVPRQSRGASWKQLALIAHKLGWSSGQRSRWYRVAEEIPLSDAHAHHLLARIDAGKKAA